MYVCKRTVTNDSKMHLRGVKLLEMYGLFFFMLAMLCGNRDSASLKPLQLVSLTFTCQLEVEECRSGFMMPLYSAS